MEKEEGLVEETVLSNGKGVHDDGKKANAKAKAAALGLLQGGRYFQFHIEWCCGQTNTKSSTTKTTNGESSTTTTTTLSKANDALYQPFRVLAHWPHKATVWIGCCQMGRAMRMMPPQRIGYITVR